MFSPDQIPSPRLSAWAKACVPGFSAARSAELIRDFARDTGHAPLTTERDRVIQAARRGDAQAFNAGAFA